MLGQRRRRWANIKTSLFKCVLLAGLPYTICFVMKFRQTILFTVDVKVVIY